MTETVGPAMGLDGIVSTVLGRMSIRVTCDGYVILEAEDVTPETCTAIVRQVLELAAFDKTDRVLTIEATGGKLSCPSDRTGQQEKSKPTDRRKKASEIR